MQETAVQVLTIHDKTDSHLSFDLKDVLQALGKLVEKWTWCITDLECFGGESEALCQAVEAAGESGIWLSPQELLKWAAAIHQTIDGTFIAYPKEIDKHALDPGAAWGDFPASSAEILIRAVDSSFFEVYTKDPKMATLLRQHFKEVRLEDPDLYFGESEAAS